MMILTNKRIYIERYGTVTSTNDLLKEKASGGAPEGTVIIADAQTAGRGRMGRRFHSPAGRGIYMSILLRTEFSGDEVCLTAHAAVAVAKAIEKQTEKAVFIKWVNDIYIDGRKVCGILTEKASDYVIVGIGINLREPEDGYPDELRSIAGAVFGKDSDYDADRLINDILIEFFKDNADLLGDYRARSMTDGKRILVRQGNTEYYARALGIDESFGLRIALRDGSETILRSGEISVSVRETDGDNK